MKKIIHHTLKLMTIVITFLVGFYAPMISSGLYILGVVVGVIITCLVLLDDN